MFERFHQLKQPSDDEALLNIYHEMMTEYGFIPLEEFKKLPIPLILELHERIVRDHRELAKSMKRR